MLTQSKSVAPEPYFSAALALLYHVVIYVRARTARPELVTSEYIQEIHELMNAIHNVPASVVEHGHWFTEERIRSAFEHFDSLHPGEDRLRLVAALDDFLAKVRRRDSSAVSQCVEADRDAEGVSAPSTLAKFCALVALHAASCGRRGLLDLECNAYGDERLYRGTLRRV